MTFQLKDRWAVITGASSGIGKAIAQELAARGCHTALVARRADRLEELAAQLKQKHSIETRVIAMDLLQQNAAVELKQKLDQLPISVLVNNAGFGATGPFETNDWAALAGVIELNIRFLTHFCHLMLPDLKTRSEGARILNLGSIAGYQGTPNMLVYGATKAFVNRFSEGLNWECEGTAVKVTCLEPGKTESEFFDVADMRRSSFVKSNVMTADQVARQGVDAMIKGKTHHITGLFNKFSVFSHRFSPPILVKWVIKYLFADLGKPKR